MGVSEELRKVLDEQPFLVQALYLEQDPDNPRCLLQRTATLEVVLHDTGEPLPENKREALFKALCSVRPHTAYGDVGMLRYLTSEKCADDYRRMHLNHPDVMPRIKLLDENHRVVTEMPMRIGLMRTLS